MLFSCKVQQQPVTQDPAYIKQFHTGVRYMLNDQNEEARLHLDQSVWDATTDLLNQYNVTLGINGAVFSKEQLGMVPEMVQEIYDSRKAAKKTMFQFEQRKILIKKILKERGAQ